MHSHNNIPFVVFVASILFSRNRKQRDTSRLLPAPFNRAPQISARTIALSDSHCFPISDLEKEDGMLIKKFAPIPVHSLTSANMIQSKLAGCIKCFKFILTISNEKNNCNNPALHSHNAISANSITITFITPTSNQASDSTLQVQVQIQSTFEITTVTGNVSGHLGTLTYDGSQYFSGTISLSGLQKGVPLQLTITVTDAFGNQQSVSENFVFAPPPKLNVISPYYKSNVYLSFPIKANCVGTGICTLHVTVNMGSIIFEKDFTNQVDTTISVQPPTGYSYVQFIATDSWGQTVPYNVPILYNNNQWISSVYNASSEIYDFNYNKALVVNDYFLGPAGKIVDITTNTFTPPTIVGEGQNAFDNPGQSFLTPYGAFFGQNLNNRPFDWNDNSIYAMGSSGTSFKTVHTSGQYATWVRIPTGDETDIYLRDLATKTDILAANVNTYAIQNDFNVANDVASNGVVVYETDHSIQKYFNNNTTTISEDITEDTLYHKPITDGHYVVYTKSLDGPFGCCRYYWLYLHDGNSEILLAYLGDLLSAPALPEPLTFYQVKNKFVAYLKPGTAGQMQIWLRDSTGLNSQVTFFGTSSTLETLNENGDIMYVNGDKRYLAQKGISQPLELGSPGVTTNKVVYRDSSWYFIEGAHIYRFLVHAYVTVSDGNWNNPATWENGIVPPANADVIILHNIIVNVNASCNSANVHAPGHVTVSPGIIFTILH